METTNSDTIAKSNASLIPFTKLVEEITMDSHNYFLEYILWPKFAGIILLQVKHGSQDGSNDSKRCIVGWLVWSVLQERTPETAEHRRAEAREVTKIRPFLPEPFFSEASSARGVSGCFPPAPKLAGLWVLGSSGRFGFWAFGALGFILGLTKSEDWWCNQICTLMAKSVGLKKEKRRHIPEP